MAKAKISPLRRRMIDDMKMRNMSPATTMSTPRQCRGSPPISAVRPTSSTVEDVREYRLHLLSRGLEPVSINPILGALRFFYSVTLGRKEMVEGIPYARIADKLPPVMTRDEVVRFLKAVDDLKIRTLFTTIYAAGLRVSEAVALTAKDINSARMVLIVRQGKGRKDRYVMLSEQLLAILRDYWRRTRPPHWLFPGPIRRAR